MNTLNLQKIKHIEGFLYFAKHMKLFFILLSIRNLDNVTMILSIKLHSFFIRLTDFGSRLVSL